MGFNVSKVSPSTISTISSLETRLLIMKVLVGAVIGLCAGGLIGGVGFATLAADSTATAFVRLQNPADLTAIAGGADQTTPNNQDNSSAFVAGEIAYLSGKGFAQAVARKMANDEPAELNIAQANESPMVTISTSSRSGDEAVRTVQTAIDLYGHELEQRVDAQLRTILPRLSEWQQRAAADPTRTQELQRVRESVELQAEQASTLLVVQPPTLNHPSSRQWLMGAVLGALVGGSCGAAVVLARRRRSGHGSLVKTVTDEVEGVLLPAVDLDMPPRNAWTDEQARLGRTLYAQCPSTGPNRLILVIGASPSSGGAAVASLLKMAAAESPTARVVDGGSVGDPTLTPDAIGAATDIVLALRIEADTVTQALALRAATASSAAPVVAVFTHRRWRGLSFGRRRRGHA
ncbi:hypothetical protein ABIA65_006410 [Mycolicibacterium sp. 624]